jgi:hypothetical protein
VFVDFVGDSFTPQVGVDLMMAGIYTRKFDFYRTLAVTVTL